MSWNPSRCPQAGELDAIETQLVPRACDLGGFEVRRALPAPARQMVGPFIFFDQMGPAEFLTGNGIDVRPHPHIGLATVTYLYDGEFQHRDSLGTNQMIYPGEVNWMIAGRGVTQSERTSAGTRVGKSSSLAFKPGWHSRTSTPRGTCGPKATGLMVVFTCLRAMIASSSHFRNEDAAKRSR